MRDEVVGVIHSIGRQIAILAEELDRGEQLNARVCADVQALLGADPSGEQQGKTQIYAMRISND